MLEWLCNLDQNFLLFLQNYVREDFLTFAMRVITMLGNAGMIWILITVILLLMPKYRKLGLTCGVALLLSLLINNLFLKNVIARTRPFDAIEGLIPLIPHPIDFSFPSGHTASSFAAGFLLFRRLPKKYGILMLGLAILISFSRLYVGVHYPSDVLAGIVSGICISYLAEWIVRVITERVKSGDGKNQS